MKGENKMKKRSFTAILLCLLMIASVCPITSQAKKAEMDFLDVDISDWSYEYIKYAFDHEYMIGISEDLFGASEYITRAQMVQTLYKMAGAPEIAEHYKTHKRFKDVEIDDWFNYATVWSAENMIAVGTGSTGGNKAYFSPNVPITRADLAVVMLRFADYLNLELTKADADYSFNDKDLIPDYAKYAVDALAGAGVIAGKGNGIFDPTAGTTRAEAATMIRAIIENSKGHSTGLLEKYGLDISVIACHRFGWTEDNCQEIRVTLTQNGKYEDELPDISIKCDVEGTNCHIYGFEFFKKDPGSYSSAISDNEIIYISYVPRSDLLNDPEGGWFYENEVLKVTLRITIGDETETIVAYPSVIYSS